MTALTEYLQRYVNQCRVLSTETMTQEDQKNLPAHWQPLLAMAPAARVHPVLLQWSPFYEEFQQTIDYLRVHLRSIEFVYTERGYSLLYEVNAGTGECAYYEGLAPITNLAASNDDNRVLDAFKKMPLPLQNFYQTLHNGWNYFASRSMGLSPLQHWFILDKYEWGILEDIGPAPISLQSNLAVYTNGMGGYVCMEFGDNSQRAHLWFAKQGPRLDIDFWAVIDTWTLIGFEE